MLESRNVSWKQGRISTRDERRFHRTTTTFQADEPPFGEVRNLIDFVPSFDAYVCADAELSVIDDRESLLEHL